jgi:NAD(P)-dependent dehydrogenase (short-subunit alcohol dehydrogenase family)
MATYLIFGGTGGIGSALCELLIADGHQVAVAAKNADKLSDIAQRLKVYPIPCDVTDAQQVQQAVDATLQQFGTLDGVANCVGSLLLKPAHLTSPEEWRNVMATNLDASFYIIKSVARQMMKTGGSIVLCASAVAKHGFHNHEAIAAAKAGINGLMLSSAATYAKRNIRINAVAPGLTRTPLTQHLTANPAAEQASVAMHALQKLGEAQDVAKAIRFLLDTEQSGWITGQLLAVDGGLSSLRPS